MIVASQDRPDPKDASGPAKGCPEPEFWWVALRPEPKRLEIKTLILSKQRSKPVFLVMSFFLLSFPLSYSQELRCLMRSRMNRANHIRSGFKTTYSTSTSQLEKIQILVFQITHKKCCIWPICCYLNLNWLFPPFVKFETVNSCFIN